MYFWLNRGQICSNITDWNKSCFWGGRSGQGHLIWFWVAYTDESFTIRPATWTWRVRLCSLYHGKMTVSRGLLLHVCFWSQGGGGGGGGGCGVWQAVLYGMKNCSALCDTQSFSIWARGERDVWGWTWAADTEGWRTWEDPALRITSLLCVRLRLTWTALIKRFYFR